nr:hypothetical protein CFP56_69674 [Quercus suber]
MRLAGYGDFASDLAGGLTQKRQRERRRYVEALLDLLAGLLCLNNRLTDAGLRLSESGMRGGLTADEEALSHAEQ